MLQPENLPQTLDVATRQLHPAERRRRLALRLGAVLESARATACREALWGEQRAEQNRIRERLGNPLEPMTVTVELFQERPERLAAIANQLRREMLEQADLAKLADRPRRRSRPKNLVELLEQPRR